MIARIESAPVARTNHVVAAAGCALALGFVAIRYFEDPANPATIFRIIVSLIAIACVVVARRQSLLHRATLFFGLEALGGLIAFAYVDVPFVLAHQHQIDTLAIAIYTIIHQF